MSSSTDPASDSAIGSDTQRSPDEVASLIAFKDDNEVTLTVVTGDRILQCRHKPKKIGTAIDAIVAGTSPEEAMTTAVSGVAGVGKSVAVVPIASISEMTWMSGQTEAKVTYDAGGKDKKLTIKADDQETLLAALGAANAIHPREAIQTQNSATVFEVAKGPVIGLVTTIGVGAFCYFLAGLEDAGDEEGGGGRNRRRGRFYAMIVQSVGQNGVLLIAGAVIAIIAFVWWRSAKNPPTRTTYTYE